MIACGKLRRLIIAQDRGDTTYLLSSPENARRLLAAIADARAGIGVRTIAMPELRREFGL